MKEEHLFKAIDLMFQSPSHSITMEFQGGEPSLPFQLLQKAVKRTVALNQEFKTKMCSDVNKSRKAFLVLSRVAILSISSGIGLSEIKKLATKSL